MSVNGEKGVSLPPVTTVTTTDIEGHRKTKTTFRVIIVTFDIASMACVGVFLNRSLPKNKASVLPTYYASDFKAQIYTLVPLSLSILWCMFTTYRLHFHHPPRALPFLTNAGCELFLFLTLVAAVLLSCFYMKELDPLIFTDKTDWYNNADYVTGDLAILDDIANRGLLETFDASWAACAALIHMSFFLRACTNAAKRRREKRMRNTPEDVQNMRTNGPAASGQQHIEMLGDVQNRPEMLGDMRQPAELAMLLSEPSQSSPPPYSLVAELPATNEHNALREGWSASSPPYPHRESVARGRI